MRAIDLDNLDLESARRAFAKARTEKPWCTRDKKDPNSYRVISRLKVVRGRETEPHFVTFIMGEGFRFAICTCTSVLYNSDKGKICYGIARAYLPHKRRLERDKQKESEVRAA